jgi:hypothetical protein
MPVLKMPIDTHAWTFTASTAPEAVVDFDSKAPKANANGEPLYSIQLVAFGEGGANVISVKFAGVPGPGVKQGASVKVSGLVATPWERNGRAGISFTAAGIEAANGSTPKGGAGA